MTEEVMLMAEEIHAGTILIKEGTPLPAGMQLESDPYLESWRLIRSPSGSGIDRKLCDAGWTFFYMAGEVDAMGFGWEPEKTVRKAVKQAIVNMNSDRYNCLEISHVDRKHFLGLHCVTIAVHPRHIQKGMNMFDDKLFAEWNQAKLAAI